ncbi:unnamed protein product, partial [Darwinula stevensoni]
METTPDATNITGPLSTSIYTVNLAAELTDPSVYVKELPPPKYQPEINITTSITLHHIESISAQSSDFSVYLMLRHVWQDKRLNFENKNTWYLEDEYLSGSEWLYNLIWSPTLFFVNEKDSNVFQLSKRNVFVAISKNGTVTLTYRRVRSCFTSVLRFKEVTARWVSRELIFDQKVNRVTAASDRLNRYDEEKGNVLSSILTRDETAKVRFFCLMDLKRFPFDEQTCNMTIASWDIPIPKGRLQWENPVDCIAREEDLIASEQTFHSHECFEEEFRDFHGITGKRFSAITVRFRIKRDPGHYILDYYVPSIFLVVVSWVSFWLDPNASPARVALGTSTMLTFITLSRNIGDELPKLSYLRAVEIWFFVCIAFIFLTLVEFAFANIISRRRCVQHLPKCVLVHMPYEEVWSNNHVTKQTTPHHHLLCTKFVRFAHPSWHGRDVDTNQLSVNSFDKVYFTVTPSSNTETLNMPDDDCKDIKISVPITSIGGDESASSKHRQRK